MKITQWMTCFYMATLCATADASPGPATPTTGHGPWTGSAELGGVVTTGNSRTSSLDARFKLGYASGPWTSTAQLQALRATSQGTTTAQRTAGELGTHYLLNQADYLFANLRDTRDQFSGYDYQATTSLGIGRQLWHTQAIDLSAEIGPGFRQARPAGGQTQRNAVVRARAKFTYRFASHAQFEQSLTTIAGSNNTELDAKTSLSTAISGALALKLSYTVLHNTQVPLGQKKTDTYTAVNLVYSFE